jgi:3-isopropylmalate/(R)-2-methylmalate dehydratase large subunit
MPQTLAEKIWDSHVVGRRMDDKELVYMDRHVMHELHAPRAMRRLAEANRTVRRPDLTFGVLDHAVATVPGRDAESNVEGAPLAKAMREGAQRFGFRLFDIDEPEQGIAHVVAPELGMVMPGATHACPDSHACTVGGLGALAFACGTSELEHVLATQVIALTRPKQMRIRLDGRLGGGVTAKDVILHLISRLGIAGARGHIVEFAGPVTSELSIEGRLTLCNMAIEMGARTGLIAPDAKTFAWLAGRPWAPSGAQWDQIVNDGAGLISDADARFDSDLVVDCSALEPQVTWGTDPSHVVGVNEPLPEPDAAGGDRADAMRRAYDYMGLQPGMMLAGQPIHRVFIGSCTNARLEDLEDAAAIARGRHVADGVSALVVPGSSAVKRDAEAAGLDAVFRAAGFEWHESGCSMCAGANGDAAAPGQRVLSTSNRNFEGRQGPGVRTHLVSPAMAAAAAVTGAIVDARTLERASG